eukprot:TRINITY_DN18624_c0_g1_i1.p1 TRINITY_DN18624_c0_g1~~TRINITY_DN18624_c0_g1_i1.p1  ORF type:complete len:319 (-),score=89.14 TRINITY_DN18624_c0_g1_i1:57-1013(-)
MADLCRCRDPKVRFRGFAAVVTFLATVVVLLHPCGSDRDADADVASDVLTSGAFESSAAFAADNDGDGKVRRPRGERRPQRWRHLSDAGAGASAPSLLEVEESSSSSSTADAQRDEAAEAVSDAAQAKLVTGALASATTQLHSLKADLDASSATASSARKAVTSFVATALKPMENEGANMAIAAQMLKRHLVAAHSDILAIVAHENNEDQDRAAEMAQEGIVSEAEELESENPVFLKEFHRGSLHLQQLRDDMEQAIKSEDFTKTMDLDTRIKHLQSSLTRLKKLAKKKAEAVEHRDFKGAKSIMDEVHAVLNSSDFT